MLSLILAALCYALYRWLAARDARRQLMAVAFLFSIWFVFAAVMEFCTYFIDDFVGYAGLAVLFLAPLAVVFVAGILVANGLRMFRREGRSLGNSLSGLLGIGLIVLPVVAVLLVIFGGVVGPAIAFFLFMVSAQVGVSFLVFWTYSKLYARRPVLDGPDAVVVLGSGLIKGKVPPLLAARLDLGIAAFRDHREPGRSLMIPSGGQGPNEPRPEGEAMAEYLVEHGVDPNEVVAETRSRTTEQNLRFSREVATEAVSARFAAAQTLAMPDDASASAAHHAFQPAESRPGGSQHDGAGRRPAVGHCGQAAQRPLLVVTNGYHARWAALISRKVGVDAQAIGAKTARYFVPSAFLREFVAVLKMNKWLHVVVAGLSFLVTVSLIGVALNWFGV